MAKRKTKKKKTAKKKAPKKKTTKKKAPKKKTKKKKTTKKKTTKKKTKKKPTKKKKTKKKTSKRGGKGAWTADDIKTLKKLFPKNPTSMVAKELGRGVDAVKRKASRMGLKKNKTYMKSIGRG